MRKILVLFAVLCASAAGCASDREERTANGSPPEATTPAGSETAGPEPIAVPDVVGQDLQLAQDTMQAAGLYNLTSHDSTGQDRVQLIDRNWKITEQSPAAGSTVDAGQLIDLGVKKSTDTADSHTPAGEITVPDVVGMDLQLAQDTMQDAGLYNLTSHDSTEQGRMQLIDRNWKVTEQQPPVGTKVDSDQLIDLGAEKFTD